MACLDLLLDQTTFLDFGASDLKRKKSQPRQPTAQASPSRHVLSAGKNHIAVLVFAVENYDIEINIQIWSKSKYPLHIGINASTLRIK